MRIGTHLRPLSPAWDDYYCPEQFEKTVILDLQPLKTMHSGIIIDGIKYSIRSIPEA
jgi:hypothetical protein